MFSNDWKVLLMAPLAAALLAACAHNSDDPADTPSSPYAGLWVSQETPAQVDQCRHHVRLQQMPNIESIYVMGDGSVVRYTDKDTFSNAEARKALTLGRVESTGQFKRNTASAYGPGISDGVFGNFDGTHLIKRSLYGQEERTYVRTTDTQLQSYRVELVHCLGYGQGYNGQTPGYYGPQPQQFSQIQPPNGVPPNYPVDPRIVTPGPQQGQPPAPRAQPNDGSYPPPPEMYQPDRRNQPWLQQPVPQPTDR